MRPRPKLETIKIDPMEALIDWQLRSIYTEAIYSIRPSKRAWKYQYHVETHVPKNSTEDEYIAAYDRKYHKKHQKLSEVEDRLLDGYTHVEIAGLLGMTVRHVEDLVKTLRRFYGNRKS